MHLPFSQQYFMGLWWQKTARENICFGGKGALRNVGALSLIVGLDPRGPTADIGVIYHLPDKT